MRLSQLKYFIQTVESGSVNAAAKELNLSQPTITTAIKELESELDVSLFNRQKQRMIPTEAGMFFYSKAIVAINSLEQAAKDVRTKRQRSHTLTIGIPPMIGSFVIPVIVKKFNSTEPDLKLDIVEHKADVLKNMLSEGLLDFCIFLASARRGLPVNTLNLINTRYSLFVSETHPLRQKGFAEFDDFKNERFIVFDRILLRNAELSSRFKAEDITPDIVMYTSQLETIKNYVRNNLAVTFLLDDCVYPYDGLYEIPTEFKLSTQISLAWNKHISLSPIQTKGYNIIRKIDFHKELE